jgi:hypothetical protein
VAAAGDDDELGGAQPAFELDGGAEADGVVAIAPHQQSGNPLEAAQRGLEFFLLGEPAASDAEDVAQGGGTTEASGNLLA